MSHRTDHLPESNSLIKFIRELRYHEASRQILAIVFIVAVSLLGKPSSLHIFYAGAVLVVLGLIIRLWASGHVKKNKVLAVDGPYAYVRHPLYVGNILLLLGFCVSSSLWLSIVLLAAFLYFYYIPAIDYEDRKLHKLFGQDWEKWSKNTLALIPKFKGFKQQDAGSWSFNQSLRQNGEPIIVLFLIYWLYHLYGKI